MKFWGGRVVGLKQTVVWAGICWRSWPETSWIWTQAAHFFLLPSLLPLFFLFFQRCYVASFLTEYHVSPSKNLREIYACSLLRSSSFLSSFLTSSLSFLSFSCCALLHSPTNKQWCLNCRLFTFHKKQDVVMNYGMSFLLPFLANPVYK